MNLMLLLTLVYYFTMQLGHMESANILAVYHVPSPSHQILGEAILKGLSAKGHTVTFVSPFKLKINVPNCKHIILDGIVDKMAKFTIVFQPTKHNRFHTELSNFSDIVSELTEQTLNSTAMQNLLESDEQFDLIIIDGFFNSAFYGLAHHFKAPIIVSSSSGSFMVNHVTGNPAPFSFVPNMLLPFSDKMTFFQRVVNTCSAVLGNLLVDLIILRKQETMYKKYFKDGPNLKDLENNVSLAFVNSHPVLETPRPYLPNMIPIGGYHVEEPKKLAQDLQLFLDNAKDGVVYCSLGSNLKSAELPKEKVDAFIKSFAKLQQKVLWKWEDDNLPNKPENVRIEKWLPQRDILVHPNVKVFITHGGLLSNIETVISGVPIIGIPFFGDQTANVGTVVNSGYGLSILFEELTEETLSKALGEIIYNPKYREEVKRRSAIIQDQPMKPLDSAIYWIEHVLRHKGGRHLHSAATELNIFQYLLLDVAALFLTIMIMFLSGFYYLIKLCCSRTNINQSDSKKKIQ